MGRGGSRVPDADGGCGLAGREWASLHDRGSLPAQGARQRISKRLIVADRPANRGFADRSVAAVDDDRLPPTRNLKFL